MAEEATRRAERVADEGVKRAQRMAEKVEEIVKGVEDMVEKFVRRMPRPEFHHGHGAQHDHQPGEAHQPHQTHHYSGNHHSGSAPATTIYHHYYHGPTAVTDTSTTIVTSTAVTTSTATITYVTLTATTTAITSTATAFLDAAGQTKELSYKRVLGHACSPSFWILGLFLLIYSIALCSLLKYKSPQDPKTKPRTSSLTQLHFDLTSLQPYITTPLRQAFAVSLCRIAAALYCLEAYWIINTSWKLFTTTLEIRQYGTLGFFFMVIVVIPLYLTIWSIFGCTLYVVLDLPFTFVNELGLLPVTADADQAPTSKGKKGSKNDTYGGNKKTDIDKQSAGSESEEGWQTDLHG